MKSDVAAARKILAAENLTCVLVRGEHIYRSNEAGVRPLVAWLDNGIDARGFSAADKVIGKAAALLFVYLGVSEVYGKIISKAAIPVFEKHKIKCACGELVDSINNCRMEAAVADINESEAALRAIKEVCKSQK